MFNRCSSNKTHKLRRMFTILTAVNFNSYDLTGQAGAVIIPIKVTSSALCISQNDFIQWQEWRININKYCIRSHFICQLQSHAIDPLMHLSGILRLSAQSEVKPLCKKWIKWTFTVKIRPDFFSEHEASGYTCTLFLLDILKIKPDRGREKMPHP